ncbi:DUF4489 domain-containing protein [Wukongibacter baidiensis]
MRYNRDCLDCKSCKPADIFDRCTPKHPKPQKVLLECGEGAGFKTFTSSDDDPFQIAFITVDTTCLNKAEVLIKFSSLVKMDRVSILSTTTRLQYELFRVCDGGKATSLGIWMFEDVNTQNISFNSFEESFSFIFCDCLNCNRCCEYFVTVTPIEITEAIVTVNNGRIAALAQSLCDSSEINEDYDPQDRDNKINQNHPKPKEILLECGQSNGSVIFRDQTDPAINIAHATIDTTCLTRPNVLLDFSSTIKFNVGIFDICLEFELFRVCADGEPLSRGTWRFERKGLNIPLEFDESFSFIYCEPLTCPGCCEYFVTVSVLEITVSANQPDAFILIDNGRMTALAQSTKDFNFHENYKSNYEKFDYIDCQSKHPIPRKILLECGSGTGSKTFTPSSEETPFQLAGVTINTSSFCKPLVNIEFSSIVSFERLSGISDDGRLQYELFRVCEGKTPISVGVWSIGRRNFSSTEKVTNEFDFTFCDCLTCPSCCDYFVTVKPIGIEFLATVSNGGIAALAQNG